MKYLMATAALFTIYVPLHACFNPADQWAAGVIWTADEPVHFVLIESLGTEGVHYIKEGKGDEVKYIFRSHYDPQHAMVFLGYFTMTYQPQAAPRLAVILDTTQDREGFNFAGAVRTELDWLDNHGVVTMAGNTRQELEDSLAATGRGDAQYWTLQKKVLSYNMWFEYDSLQGVWSMTGVNGVKGCGLDVAFQLPPEELGSSAVNDGLVFRSLPLNVPAGQTCRVLDLQGKPAGRGNRRSGVYFLTGSGFRPVKIIKLGN